MQHPTRFFWLLVLTLLIAAFLRLWQVGALPPGLHYDEAADTIIAQQIARGESTPIFVAAYTGKEVLFFYWAALWMKLIGPTVFAMRLAAALMGMLTVAVTYRVVLELLAPYPVPFSLMGQGARGKGLSAVALLTTIFIAASFWHVLMSRLGFRSIGEPFVQALALAALFRGLRLKRWRWIASAGALVGLSLYTYLAARLFPVAIATIFFHLILFDRGRRRLRLAQFVVAAVMALIVFAPLGVYFLDNSGAFLTRIQQVAPRADQAAALIENVLQALGMFFVSGDPYIRFNLPYRPLFIGLWGLLFIAGWIAALVGVFRGRTVWRRTAYFSVIVTTSIMLLPTALAVNEITPSNLRAIGMMPLVFVLPALGVWWIIQRVWALINAAKRRFVTTQPHPSAPQQAHSERNAVQSKNALAAPLRMLEPEQLRRFAFLPFVLALVLLMTTVEAGAAYFGQYVREPQLYIQSDGDLADIARALDNTDTHGEPVYIAALHYRHPTVAALSEKYGDVKWIAGNRAVVLPDGPGYLFFARLGLPDESWLQRFLPDSALIAKPLAPDGETNYRLYHLTSPAVITPQVKMDVNFGNIIELIGYDVEHPERSPSGAESKDAAVGVTLYWRVLNKPDRGDYSTFAQLRDAWGFEWGQGGSFDYPSEQWAPGEIIVNHIDAPIAAGAPPGDYELRVGWFSLASNQRLNVVAPDGGFGGTVARLASIPVARLTIADSQLNMGARLDREAAPGLRLLGYTQETSTAQPGAPIDFTLFWQSTAKLDDAPLTIQLTSCGCASQPKVTQLLTTTLPVHGAYPFSRWTPGEVVADRYRVRAPFDLPPSEYTVEVAVGNAMPIGLGTIEVRPAKRVLSEPPIDHRLEAQLDGAIELIGYHLDQTDQAITLTLVWRTLRSIDQDYTIFTHVLDRSGQQIGGKDNAPVNGTYPTSYWMAGEYVIDEYVIPVKPPEGYGIEVGLYDPETGAHLGGTIRLK